MWKNTSHRPAAADYYSWVVRAFAEEEDTSSIATWHIPRTSYTCSFCQREFRSAQALGGHMNVHRRDRARLPQYSQGATTTPSSISMISNFTRPVTVDSPYQPAPASLLDKVGMFRDSHDDVGNDSVSGSSSGGTVVEDVDLELRLGW